MPANSVTLIANFEAGSTPYVVEHYLVSGSGVNLRDTDRLSGLTGATVTAVPKDYAGYTLDSAHPLAVPAGTVAAGGGLVLKLYYRINTYTVTFEDYDGTVIETETVEYGSDASAPAHPTREGYTFTGWDKPESAWTKVTEDVVVTARYRENDKPPVTPPVTPSDEPVADPPVTSDDPPDNPSDTPTVASPPPWEFNPNGWADYVPDADSPNAIDEVDGNEGSDSVETPDDTKIIEKPDVPRTAGGIWSLFNLLCMVFAAAAALVCAAATLTRRKVRIMRHVPLALSLLFAVALVILFFMTQDVRLKMELFDKWSIAFAAGVSAAILAARLAFGKKLAE
jgi:uncharacterized repeat protein (TIGR02543 family)